MAQPQLTPVVRQPVLDSVRAKRETVMDNNRSSYRLGRMTGMVGLILLLNMILMLATPPLSVMACTPPAGGLPPYAVADRTNAAEVVVEGTIIALTDAGNYGAIKTATVEVQRYFKGNGPAVVNIARFGPGSLCLSQVSIGQHWIFYTTGDPKTGLTAHYLSQFDAVDPATPDNVAQVIAAVGHDPVRPYGYWVYLPIILKTSSSDISRSK